MQPPYAIYKGESLNQVHEAFLRRKPSREKIKFNDDKYIVSNTQVDLYEIEYKGAHLSIKYEDEKDLGNALDIIKKHLGLELKLVERKD